jgi:hypothetical protein
MQASPNTLILSEFDEPDLLPIDRPEEHCQHTVILTLEIFQTTNNLTRVWISLPDGFSLPR